MTMEVAPLPVSFGGSKSSVLPSASTTVPQSIYIHLSSAKFILSWWAVLLFHVQLGSHAFSVTALHRYLQNPGVSDAFAGTNVPHQTLQVTARSFFLVGLAHFVAIVRMVSHSIKAKKLVFHGEKSVKSVEIPPASPRFIPRYLTLKIDYIVSLWDGLFTGTGYFALRGPHFEVIFMLREAIEILLQTYQAYYLSRSVPRPWINQLAVSSIVLNCVASPFVHWFYKHNIARRRLVNLLQDAVLDLCCSVVIPLSIVLPYVAVFDADSSSFPPQLLMNDVWYVNAISEGRQVLVTSFLDFVSTILPHIGLFSCLMTVKTVIRRQSSRIQDVSLPDPSIAQVPQRARLTSGTTQEVQPSSPSMGHIVLATRLRHASRNPEYANEWRRFLVHVGFLAWGVFVVLMHLDAQIKPGQSVQGCELYVNAWLHTRFPRSVMLLNCHMQGIRGSTEEITAWLDQLERQSLQVLVYSHCPALEMPPILAEFPYMGGLELFNSSVVDWPAEAAVRAETHTRLTYVYLVFSNWTTFPNGLLHEELPCSLTHLAIIGNNMTELPQEIGDVWETHEWLTVDFERVPRLEQVPASFCKFQTVILELTNTGITGFAPDCFPGTNLERFVISGSFVASLSALEGSQVSEFFGEYTSIEELPAWFEGWVDHAAKVSLYGSPVCNSSALRTRTELWERVCSVNEGTARGFYPWETMLYGSVGSRR